MLVVCDHLFTFKEEKGMIFFKNWRHRGNVPPILLNGIPLPWVDRMKHLGNWEHTSMLKHYYMVLNVDLKSEESQVYGEDQISQPGEELHFWRADVLIRLYNIYYCCFCGSNLYDLCSLLFLEHCCCTKGSIPNTTPTLISLKASQTLSIIIQS